MFTHFNSVLERSKAKTTEVFTINEARVYHQFCTLKVENRFGLVLMSNVDDSGEHTIFSGIKYNHLIGGICGGVIATLVTHPFDLIKLRLAGKFLCVIP